MYLYGGVVSYCSQRLKVIAHSTAEAEYAAASYTCKEIVFIRSLLSDLGVSLMGETVLAVDNEAAIKIARNQGVTKLNKHFTDATHYLRHLVDHKVVDVVHVTTKQQNADGLTKPLEARSRVDFKSWAAKLVTMCGTREEP